MSNNFGCRPIISTEAREKLLDRLSWQRLSGTCACLILPQRDRRYLERSIGSKIVFSHLRRGTRTLQQHRNEVRAR